MTDYLGAEKKARALAADEKLHTGLFGQVQREQLTSIFSVLPALMNRADETAVGYCETIQNECYGILRTTQNIEMFGLLGKGRNLPLHDINYTALLACVCSNVAYINKVSSITFASKLPKSTLAIRGNAEVLTVAILNIIRNSVQFSNERNKIEISLGKVGSQAILRVKDSGLGIKPEYAQKVFEPYFTQDPYGDNVEQQGLGLGLALVQRSAKAMGGNVVIESQFGRGTAISLSLPLVKVETPQTLGKPDDILLNRYSSLYIQMCGYCKYPDMR